MKIGSSVDRTSSSVTTGTLQIESFAQDFNVPFDLFYEAANREETDS